MSIKRTILSELTLLAAFYCSAADNLADRLPDASIGYIITDLRNGQIVSELNSDKALVPASLLKMITASAALDKVGSNYRYSTILKLSGYVDADTLHGDLIVCGDGDPSLGYSLTDSLKALDVRHITGNVVITPFAEPYINGTWMVEDVGTDYGVGWLPVNYKQNEILINDYNIAVNADAIVADIAYDLVSSGITIDGMEHPDYDAEPIELSVVYSQTMGELASTMIRESNNLYAEALGRILSPDASYSSCLDSLCSYACRHGIDPKISRFNDFCGLSRINLITPEMLSQFLISKSNDSEFVGLFPRAGSEGTVKNFLRGKQNRHQFVLKTGSMNGILNYAGYKLNQSGIPTHAIVVMVNNCCRPTSKIKEAIEGWITKYF